MATEQTVTVVRYRVKPGRAKENAELVRAVYEELAQLAPSGFRYITSVLDDGVTFVHVGDHGRRGAGAAARRRGVPGVPGGAG